MFAFGDGLWYSDAQNEAQDVPVRGDVARTAAIDYDRTAHDYATHRQLHAGVFEDLCQRGRLGPDSTVLEVGCGTGSYVRAMADRYPLAAYGLDPSSGDAEPGSRPSGACRLGTGSR